MNVYYIQKIMGGGEGRASKEKYFTPISNLQVQSPFFVYRLAQKSVNWLVKCTLEYVRNFYYLLILQKCLEIRYSTFNAQLITLIQFYKFKSEHLH
jgi:hypothetical protein